MARISVDLSENPNGWIAKVTVEERKSSSNHTVELENSYYQLISSEGKYTPQQVIETAFEFLLAREPKESILSRFDLPIISRYFNSFENELPRMLRKKYS